MLCKKCSKEIDADSEFCIHCGKKVKNKKKIKPKEEKIKPKEEKIQPEPQDRGTKIYLKANKFINDWASNDEKNKNYKRIVKLITEIDDGIFLTYMSFINKDSIIEKIPNVLEQKYDFVNYVGVTNYWNTFHGYIYYLAKKEVDGESLEKKINTTGELSKEYEKAIMSLDDAITRGCNIFADSKMSMLEEKNKEIKDFNHNDYDAIKAELIKSFNTGYTIAQIIWG